VLARHEAHVLVLEALDDVAELGQAPPPLLRIVRGVREVAGEDDEGFTTGPLKPQCVSESWTK